MARIELTPDEVTRLSDEELSVLQQQAFAAHRMLLLEQVERSAKATSVRDALGKIVHSDPRYAELLRAATAQATPPDKAP